MPQYNGKHFSKAKPEPASFAVARLSQTPSAIEITVGHVMVRVPTGQPAIWLADFVKVIA